MHVARFVQQHAHVCMRIAEMPGSCARVLPAFSHACVNAHCRDARLMWVAHVLPIYVVRFSLSPRDALQLYASMDLREMLSAIRNIKIPPARAKSQPHSFDLCSLTRGVHQHFLSDPLLLGCMYMNPEVKIPDTHCVQGLYMATYGIDLCTEYQTVCGAEYSLGTSAEPSADVSSFMHKFISLVHVAACSLQLLVCIRSKKVAKVVPE